MLQVPYSISGQKMISPISSSIPGGGGRGKGGRVVRWCWVNFQCRASFNFDYSRARAIALAVGTGGGGLDIFTLIYLFSSFSLSPGDGPI